MISFFIIRGFSNIALPTLCFILKFNLYIYCFHVLSKREIFASFSPFYLTIIVNFFLKKSKTVIRILSHIKLFSGLLKIFNTIIDKEPLLWRIVIERVHCTIILFLIYFLCVSSTNGHTFLQRWCEKKTLYVILKLG